MATAAFDQSLSTAISAFAFSSSAPAEELRLERTRTQAPNAANAAKVRYVRDISGPSPFAPDGCGLGTTDQGAEYEPDIAANPRHRGNLVAVFSQDNQISNVVATSRDRGRHWVEVMVPGLSQCTGGSHIAAFDARVAFGPDGIAYLSSPVVDRAGGSISWTLLVNQSTDRGLSWSDPVVIDQAGPFPAASLDFPVLTADPHRPATAYLAWSRILPLATVPQFFARTTDGGLSWTSPAEIPITPQPGQAPFGSHIRVLPDGTLVDVFVQVHVNGGPVGPTGIWVVRSQDQGDSWSAPIHVADIPVNVVTDPDSAAGLGRGSSWEVPSVAVGGDGTLYAVWHLIDSTSSSQILFAKSLDGGLTWSDPAPVAIEATQAFKPTVAVSRAGPIGVTYFDFRNDVPGDAELTTDLWFRHSHDAGATWTETHVAGPFDLRPAPSPGAFPLGDYFGLVPIGRTAFGVAFVRTIAPATEGATDAFFARLRVQPRRRP